jgi:hypothetical protein
MRIRGFVCEQKVDQLEKSSEGGRNAVHFAD